MIERPLAMRSEGRVSQRRSIPGSSSEADDSLGPNCTRQCFRRREGSSASPTAEELNSGGPGVWRTLAEKVTDFELPRVCPVCLAVPTPVRRRPCPDCSEQLRELTVPRCPGCGGAVDGVLAQCSECLRIGSRPWVQAVSVYPFRGEARELIHRFKYNGHTALAPFLGERLAENWLRHGELLPDIVTPVPLHWARFWRRGFNQADLLARETGRRIGVPVRSLLKRRRRTSQQALLDSSMRRRNMTNAFAVSTPVDLAGCTVLVVDDVLTTGATLGAAATALLDAGATRVAVLTLARG